MLVLQENIRDKLRPVSLAITHTIKRTLHDEHAGDHTHQRLGRLTPVLSLSPSNTHQSEVTDSWVRALLSSVTDIANILLSLSVCGLGGLYQRGLW